jgi:hypothetical protein
MTPKELEQTLQSLLHRQLADAELREQLEKLAATERSFSGFTWLFGPELYRRNRILFRPFILSRFSTYMMLPKSRVEDISWIGETEPKFRAKFDGKIAFLAMLNPEQAARLRDRKGEMGDR